MTGLRSPNAGSLFGSLVATVHKHAPLQRALFPRSASQQPRATKARGTGRMLLCAPDAARGWSLLSASPCAGGQRGGHKESPALRPAIQSAPSLLTRAAPAARAKKSVTTPGVARGGTARNGTAPKARRANRCEEKCYGTARKNVRAIRAAACAGLAARQVPRARAHTHTHTHRGTIPIVLSRVHDASFPIKDMAHCGRPPPSVGGARITVT